MDFYVSARQMQGGKFKAEPGPVRLLQVPDTAVEADPSHEVKKPDLWFAALLKAACWGEDARTHKPRGDILVHVHGYNNAPADVLKRQRQLSHDLAAVGWKGVVLSFDWPSDNKTIAYLEDRHDAKKTALGLVDKLIRELSARQTPDCAINIHVLAHSMGAYVVREAFDDADDNRLSNPGWMVSQMCLIGGDVSAGSLEAGESSSASLYRHCIRLTNYSSELDSVLKLSNAKRAGLAPRVGRVGLPDQVPGHAVQVDCTDYHRRLLADAAVQAADQPQGFLGNKDHSWYIGNLQFTRDLFETLRGDLDRSQIPTREAAGQGRFRLR